MKTASRTAALWIVALLACWASGCNQPAEPGGFRAAVGYKFVPLHHEYSHDTHPDDRDSLPDGDVPGSAGKTKLTNVHFLALGGGYQGPSWQGLSFNVDAGGLAGYNRDRHENENDDRSDNGGAFVYSEAYWGFYVAAGVTYAIQKFYFGAEAQLVGVFVDDGWDRFGKDESAHSALELVPSVGPKVGYKFDEHWSVEGTAQFGEAVGAGAQVIYKW